MDVVDRVVVGLLEEGGVKGGTAGGGGVVGGVGADDAAGLLHQGAGLAEIEETDEAIVASADEGVGALGGRGGSESKSQ